MRETGKTNLSAFSVNDLEINRIRYDSKDAIIKTTKLNPSMGKISEQVFDQINLYIESFIDAKINIPTILHREFSTEEIVYICEDAGDNVFASFLPKNIKKTIEDGEVLASIFDTLYKAQSHNIHLDPHPKNYVVNDEVIKYVDFTPPYSQEYYDLRLSVASENQKPVLNDFFKCFEPSEIVIHFLGDLLKIDREIYDYAETIFELIKERNLTKLDYKNFLLRAEEVVIREKKREGEGIFLL